MAANATCGSSGPNRGVAGHPHHRPRLNGLAMGDYSLIATNSLRKTKNTAPHMQNAAHR